MLESKGMGFPSEFDTNSRETEFLPVEKFGYGIGEFVRRWSVAWTSRNLESLTSLFCDDGAFSDVRFGMSASGKSELRRLFTRVFHTTALRLVVEGVKRDHDFIVLRWLRTGARLHGVVFPRDRYAFYGTSLIKLRSNRVAACEDNWDVTDGVMHVLMSKRER